MTESEARRLVDLYVSGWLENDTDKIIKPLSGDCSVVESHGPTYEGINQIKAWVEQWKAAGNKVEKWDIDSFFVSKNAAFFEWSFICVAENTWHEIEGASVVLFKNDKIVHIHEYRMTHPSYKWSKHG